MQSNFRKFDHFYYETTTKPLGKGAFSTVFKGTDETTNQPVVIKVIPSVKLLENDTQYNLFMREINFLRGIKGSHIVQLQHVKIKPNNLYIVTDYCDGGDLEKKIKSGHQFSEEEALSILRQIVDAFVTIEDMHLVNSRGQKMTVMHRDIKAANVLFHQGQIKVADFGFAKFIEEVNKDKKQAHILLGTPLYMSPQILNNETCSSKCDIWSTGCLFYEILFGKLPYTGYSVPNLYSNIKTKPVTFPKKISEDTKQLIIHMLKVREEDRLSWKEIRDHSALKKSSPTGVQHKQQQDVPVYNGFPQMNLGGKVVSQGQKQESYQQIINPARIPLQAVTKNISH